MSNEEVWKDIEGYEGLYQISNWGKVRNSRTYSPNTHTSKTMFGKELSQRENNKGYPVVILYKKSKGKLFLVHRLVAKHFVKGYKKNLVVNHKDCNIKNRHSNNLEWVTRSRNTIHAMENNRINHFTEERIKTLNKMHDLKKKKVSIYEISTGKYIGVFESMVEASLFLGKEKSYIKGLKKRKNPKYKVILLESEGEQNGE